MATCVICAKQLSSGSFNLSDKYELFGHSFICKDCGNRIGIKSMWSAAFYTEAKAKRKYAKLFSSNTPKIINEHNDETLTAAELLMMKKQLENDNTF